MQLASAGDPRFQELWTLLHTPSLTLPSHAGPQQLPVGVQLVGRRTEDQRLLQIARWIWAQIGSAKQDVIPASQ